ncbi:hypothetical protein WIS52_01810 [Pseudonocardia nematodicida]|uniref:Mannosylglycerate hydrolase MGH1-like glycoside hydrolase domain-containing protein n=1 Tax=Pseudonocardia nematodicida TaxID=1206997 RepID=A0ABV1K412_9PSEU
MHADDLRTAAAGMLDRNWDDARGYCVPNPDTYPHLWLWDSCFHAVVWARLGDPRAARELDEVLAGQLPGGMVPHMRYGAEGPDAWLGPLPGTSSITQPPVFGHAARALADQGVAVSADTLEKARRGLDWLWEHRRTDDDLLFIVHPWEAGNDHSPRWDGWGGPGRTPADYDRAARSQWNKDLMGAVSFDDAGAAVWSSRFVAAPAGFNAYSAFAMAELAQVTGDDELAGRARRIAAAMDARLWDPAQNLWNDLALVGGAEDGGTGDIPASDGVMGALVTADGEKAQAALRQLREPERFGAPFGPANVARTHPSYDPRSYWRGPAWPQLSYLFGIALRRWGLDADADEVVRAARAVAERGEWPEYWDPETGDALGAAPQSWTALAAAMP